MAVVKGLAVYEMAAHDEYDDPWERPEPNVGKRRPSGRDKHLRVIAAGVCVTCGFVHTSEQGCGWHEPW